MANWPTAVSTTDQLHTGVNNKSTLLNGGHNNLITTITVASTSGFPSVGAITIGLERISYTSINATQFLGCTRGFGGTTAASHNNNDPVELTYGAEYHNDLRDEIIAIQQDLLDRIGFNNGFDDLNIDGHSLTLDASEFSKLYFSGGIVLRYDNGADLTSIDMGAGNGVIISTNTSGIQIFTGGSGNHIEIKPGTNLSDVLLGPASTSTTDNFGFVRIPFVSGTPTGTPSVLGSTVPIIFDTTTNKLYIYNGAWKSVTLT